MEGLEEKDGGLREEGWAGWGRKEEGDGGLTEERWGLLKREGMG